MKRAPICVIALVWCARWGFAAPIPTFNLTVVLDFKGSHSDRSVAEMQEEAQQIVRDAGIRLNWLTADQASQYTFSDLVVVQFNGACIIKPDPNIYDELGPPPGPLAFTWVTDGAVQPFGEVSCDRVAAAVRSAMSSGGFGASDALLGRALGRVLVHELVHMLTKSGEHGRSGVEERSLSGRQLTGRSLALSPPEVDRLRRDLAQR